jgi:hypothetical protein
MNKEFAKIFQHKKFGQVVVSMDSEEDKSPSISIRFQVEDGFFYNYKLGFYDTKDGYEKRNKIFEEFVEEEAFGIANHIRKVRNRYQADYITELNKELKELKEEK